MQVLGRLLLGPTTGRLPLRATTMGALALQPVRCWSRDIPAMTDEPAVAMTTGSRHVRTLGAVLILVVGLLNFWSNCW
jgi:hypothetical protein